MKTDATFRTVMVGLTLAALWGTVLDARATTSEFNVVNSGFSSYLINGAANPALTLYRGHTYVFNLNASGHPFWIKTAAVTGTGSAYDDGVTGNGTAVGATTFAVPAGAPDTLFYICQFHSAMQGALNIEDSPVRGWWRFETPGPEVHDASGNNVSGVLIDLNAGEDDGTSGYSTDVPGALITDGVFTQANLRSYRQAKGAGKISITNNLAALSLTSNPSRFTVEAFFKLGSDRFPMRFMDMKNSTSGIPPTTISPFLSSFDPKPLLGHSIISDPDTTFHTLFAVPMNPSPVAYRHWHHVAFVQDTTNTYFYLDYQLISRAHDSEYQAGPFTGLDKVCLGGILNDAANAFDGRLDEIRFSDRALAPTQFLRVVDGLPPGFRDMAVTGSAVLLTLVTESGTLYRIQGSTNLLAAPQIWSDAGGVITGKTFYTIITNPAPTARYYRARRDL